MADRLIEEYEKDCPLCGGSITVEVYVDENGEVYKVEDECAVCLGGGNI